MRISTFFYTLKQGVINIFRNKLFSLASIATISACLFLCGHFKLPERRAHGRRGRFCYRIF